MHNFMYVNETLGEVIRAYREDKGLSRTKVAEYAGIAPNSMVRYEMAGKPDGKYPPAKKLMKICEVLEIDPRHAFDAILFEEEQNTLSTANLSEDELLDHARNHFSFADHFASDLEVVRWYSDIDGFADLTNVITGMKRELGRLNAIIEDQYHINKQNGPDQKDPDRSENTTHETEAVDAASTRKPGGN